MVSSALPRALCAHAEKVKAVAASLDARSAESWTMSEVSRQQKITFEERRASGVRGIPHALFPALASIVWC